MSEIDARCLNWRFVVPHEPDGLLLLPVGGETLVGARVPGSSAEDILAALRRGPYPAVAAPDLGAWAARVGGSPAELLELLARAVSPGGWLYAGFGNPWYPPNPRRAGALRAGRAASVLRGAGLTVSRAYLPFPDHTCPAYLVTDGPRETTHFLRTLFLPYAGGRRGWRAWIFGRALSAARWAALPAPQWARSGLAPAHAVVAVRPA